MYIYLMLWAIFIAVLTSTPFARDNYSFLRVSLFLALLSIINFVYTELRKRKNKD